MKSFFIIIITSILVLSGCSSTPKLSNEVRANIKSVSINPVIEKSEFFYQGPGSGAFAVFGLVGGIASFASNISPGDKLRLFAEQNNIHIENIVLEELTKALNDSKKIPLEKSAEAATTTLDVQIYIYGFSISHGLSSDLYPMLGLRLSMKDSTGKVIWSAKDYITAIGSDVKPMTLDDMHKNPQRIESAWRDTARAIISNIVTEL